MYKTLLKPFFFLFDPEKIHHFVFASIRFIQRIPGVAALTRKLYVVNDPKLATTVFGITFPNPVGLAAGFDKDAKLFDELGAYGFGFVEVGTLTPLAQDGNPKPRMFRLPADGGLINRMGFNNEGAAAAAARLKRRKTNIIIGGNIGKNKVTPNEKAGDDYESCYHTLYPVVDYFVVNVSSPNTPNLRDLQEKEPLTALLLRLKAINSRQPAPKPILLKIAPDLTDGQLDDIITIVRDTKIDGVIATNTTISRAALRTPESRIQEIGAGGLSGQPLTRRATEVIRYLSEKSGRAFPIIGVGGIRTAQDAIEKLEAGASLVQVYTGFIYEGPAIARNINRAIAAQHHRK
ncbi:MAG: quinone-dependent dihydroorotate dehydrogenase [Bacteroidia bacterium]|jgi:dihydroorotate dehydrogenase|nr:quinone-dependent dihydroorotate dehydrogenase [Bacteroidia bacterium]